MNKNTEIKRKKPNYEGTGEDSKESVTARVHLGGLAGMFFVVPNLSKQ